MVSSIAPKKPRITSAQRRTRVDWCYKHLSCSVNDWSKDDSEIGRIKCLYVVFDTTQLDLNIHNNVYIEEGGLLMSYTNSSI